MRGECQMLADADWKAEDQRGAQARTSVGNNTDDEKVICLVGYSKMSPTDRKLRRGLEDEENPAQE